MTYNIRHKETGACGKIIAQDSAKGTATVQWDKYITQTENVPLAELEIPAEQIIAWRDQERHDLRGMGDRI